MLQVLPLQYHKAWQISSKAVVQKQIQNPGVQLQPPVLQGWLHTCSQPPSPAPALHWGRQIALQEQQPRTSVPEKASIPCPFTSHTGLCLLLPAAVLGVRGVPAHCSWAARGCTHWGQWLQQQWPGTISSPCTCSQAGTEHPGGIGREREPACLLQPQSLCSSAAVIRRPPYHNLPPRPQFSPRSRQGRGEKMCLLIMEGKQTEREKDGEEHVYFLQDLNPWQVFQQHGWKGVGRVLLPHCTPPLDPAPLWSFKHLNMHSGS